MAQSSPALQHWTICTPELTRLKVVYLTASAFLAAACTWVGTDLAWALSACSALATALVGADDTPETTAGDVAGVVANAAAEKAPMIKEAISLFMKVSFRLLNSSSCLEYTYNEPRRSPVDPNI